jgi:hypothetical protein
MNTRERTLHLKPAFQTLFREYTDTAGKSTYLHASSTKN